MARSGPWPVAFQTDGYTRREFSDNGTPFGLTGLPTTPFNLWSVGFDASWELDVAGKLRRTIEAAEADEGSVDGHNGHLVSLIGEVARTYIELRTAQERVATAQENARLQEETVRLTEERLRWGAISPLDVSQARTQLSQTQAAIPEFLNQVKLAENRLCVLQGEPPHSLEAELPSQGIPRPPSQIAVGLPLELLRRRPDMRQAERRVAAAKCTNRNCGR